MSTARERWNRRHAEGSVGPPSPFLVESARYLPTSGKAIDLAGGPGRNSLWLAERGLEVTLVDVSDVALAQAEAEATRRGLAIEIAWADLEADAAPVGTWDVVVCFHYLNRALLAGIADMLVMGGRLVCQIATRRNLERHPRPPEPFLLDAGELLDLTAGLEPLSYAEDWDHDGRHSARLVASRS